MEAKPRCNNIEGFSMNAVISLGLSGEEHGEILLERNDSIRTHIQRS